MTACAPTSVPLEDAGLLPRDGEVDLRYKGQSFELTVSLAGDLAGESFHRAHEERYGYADRGARDRARRRAHGRDPPGPALDLRGGAPLPVSGPVVVELDGATCWLPPGWEGVRDGTSTLIRDGA